MIKTVLAKPLTTKVAVAASATAAVGGVAAVAATGHLPDVSGGSPTPGSAAASSAPASESSHAGARSNGNGDSNASPSPSLLGLCHAYTASAGSAHGKALENPAFRILISTAAGEDQVAAHCAKLLAEPSSAATSKAPAKEHNTEAHATPDPSTRSRSVTTARPSH